MQLQLGEAGPLQGLPALPGEVAAIKQEEPDRVQDLLPEVNPGGALCCHVLHEVKRPSLGKEETFQKI